MKIGVLGSATVGQILAKAFLSEGHDVMIGSRDPLKEDMVKFKNENAGMSVGTLAETAAFGEVVVLATKGSAIEHAIQLAGVENFSGKVVIDSTNPVADAPPVNGVLQYFTGIGESLMERIQKLIPDAKVVKAFNSVGNTVIYQPNFEEGKASMFICGNDADAKKQVSSIVESFGWEPEDLGAIESARAIEPLCILWCIPGFINNQWKHGLKLIKK